MQSPEEAQRRKSVMSVAGTKEGFREEELRRMRRSLVQVRDGVDGGLGDKMEE